LDQLTIFLPGPPVAKGRPKFARRGNCAFAYTPAKTRDYEKALAAAASEAMAGRPLLTGPLTLCVLAYVAIPFSWSKKKQEQAKSGEIRPITRPDTDNYSKAVLDALNCVVYMDDSQVVDLYSSKYYSVTPSIHITLRSAAHDREKVQRARDIKPSPSAHSERSNIL
jgi:Holliday junction resolvase RusA-like endonuclease